MEGEARRLIKVTAWVAASMAYARFASASVKPGKVRLLALLPVLCLLPLLPCSFSSVNLRGISAFFLAWLALFKLLLLSFGLGPLSPSLPLLTFIATASLPVKLKLKPINPSSPPLFRRLLGSAAKAVLFAAFLSLYRYRDRIHPYPLLALYTLYVYLSLEFVLTSSAALAGLLGLDLEPQFDAPLRSTSLQDFWGRRWNLMVTGILRPAVYVPVSARWGRAAGVMAAFLASGIMHELMFYYLTAENPTGEVACFFAVHGLCTVAEARARRSGWWPRPAVALPLSLGFLAATLSWLFFPPLLRSGVDERSLQEWVAMVGFLEDGARALVDRLTWTAVQ